MAQILLRNPNIRIGKADLFVDPYDLVEKIVLDQGKSIDLTLTGLPRNSAAPSWILSKQGVISVSTPVRAGNNWNFSVKAIGAGTASFFAMGPSSSLSSSIHVVAGAIQNHTGMTKDLIADIFRAGDASKMQALVRMLHNRVDNLFNENSQQNISKHGTLACGTVSKVGGILVFNPGTKYTYQNYYKTIPHTVVNGRKVFTITDRSDVKYDEQTLQRGRDAIKAKLLKGMPVVAGLAYIPSSSIDKFGYLQPTGEGGHSVLVVGSNADASQLLYIDVFGPDGSRRPHIRGSILKYEGGPAGQNAFPDVCEHLGVFELTTEPRGKVMRQISSTQAPGGMFDGDQFLEIVSGPLS